MSGQQQVRERGECVGFRSTYGWVRSAVDGAELFTHFTELDGVGFRSLAPGDVVTFVRGQDSQGRPCAKQVQREQEGV